MKIDKTIGLLTGMLLVSLSLAAGGESTWESEKLALEVRMQERVEAAVSRILPRDLFVVVIQVEPIPQTAFNKADVAKKSSEDEFFLPGVPAKQSFSNEGESIDALVETLKPDPKGFMRFIQRMTATVVIDRDVPDDTVEKIRTLTRQMLGLRADRGDTLDIERTAFHKTDVMDRMQGIAKIQEELKANWLIVSLVLTVFCILFFFLFVFGPLRGFLNRFVQILPTLKPISPGGGRREGFNGPQMDPNIFPALMAQAMGMLPPSQGGGGPGGSNFSGSLMVENPNKQTTPFGFIREHHLSNLAVLLGKETPEKAAVVLGYLPPEWISRVLSKIDPYMQSQITENLATTRQLLPEQVEDIEQDLKRRLDYLIGGPDRIFAVYESLDADGQLKMLENLRQTRPELAEELRKRTFLFEDLRELEQESLKTLLREIDLQTLISALRGLEESLKEKLIGALSAGKAEIVREEMEFTEGKPNRASFDAQKRIVQLFKRLEAEGQIQNPRNTMEGGAAPATRYGSGLKGLEAMKFSEEEEGTAEEQVEAEVVSDDEDAGIQQKIRNFMSRGTSGAVRYPGTEENTDDKEKGE